MRRKTRRGPADTEPTQRDRSDNKFQNSRGTYVFSQQNVISPKLFQEME